MSNWILWHLRLEILMNYFVSSYTILLNQEIMLLNIKYLLHFEHFYI